MDIDPLKNYNKKAPGAPKDEHFMRRQGYVDKKKNYSTDVKDGIMTLKDFVKAQEYAHSAKEKYLAKRKK